jgi:hypothetical protein
MRAMSTDRGLDRALSAVSRVVAADAGLLVTKGQLARPGTERVIVVEVVDRAPRQRWDDFLARADVAALCAGLEQLGHHVFPGENDAMFATAWARVWTVAPAPFLLFDRRCLRCSVEDGAVWVYPARGAPRSIPVGTARRVTSWVSEDWVRRGVSLECSDGEVVIAEEHDSIATVDPTFDWINLTFEAGWANGLGRSLAAALELPFASFEDEG